MIIMANIMKLNRKIIRLFVDIQDQALLRWELEEFKTSKGKWA